MKRLNFVVCAALAVLVLSTLTTLRASAAPQITITVTNNLDETTSGDGCSLREAIVNANDNAQTYTDCVGGSGTDTIHFNIGSGGTQTIKPNSQLPTITNPVTIDGTSQSCSNYPCIVIDGKNAPNATGLYITAGSSTINRLVINRFQDVGISIVSNGSNVITGNYIGTNVDGTIAHGNEFGVYIINGSSGNTIGGTSSAARNIISGNVQSGVLIQDSGTGNMVEGNYIGTDVTGTKALGNGSMGIGIFGGASDNTIGGTGNGAGNIIAYNFNGVLVGNSVTDDSTKHNAIQGNSIHDNAFLGIDLGWDGHTANDSSAMDADTGPNGLQNYPKIKTATSSGTPTITGKLHSKPLKTYTIELFYSSKCDASGYGEGKNFLGRTTVTTDSNGKGSFTFTTSPGAFSAGDQIKATATDSNGNTSEFSKCVTAQ